MVQDLPEVPTSASEDINDKLDLPDVPTKAPGAADMATKDAGVSSKRKGIYPLSVIGCRQPFPNIQNFKIS